MVLFVINKLFHFVTRLFLILFKDHSSHIIFSKAYQINIYEICKTILVDWDDHDKDLSIKEKYR